MYMLRKPSEDNNSSFRGGGSKPKKLKYTPLLGDWEDEDEDVGGEHD